MLLVVPVSKSDLDNPDGFNAFITIIKYFGPYLSHELLVVSRPADRIIANHMLTKLEGLFRKASCFVFPTDGPSGWPQGPNYFWKQTILHLKQTGNTLPWFWMEVDVTPVKPRWLDLLQKEYEEKNQLHMGILMPTIHVTKKDRRITVAKHLQGTAVYASNLGDITTLWNYVDEVDTAFDVITQWEIVPFTANTNSVQQGFQTRKYKLSFDSKYSTRVIRGEDLGKLSIAGAETYDTPIYKSTIVHHGCKDGSLAKLILETQNPEQYFI